MEHPLISPEKPGEFDGVPDYLVTLIRQARLMKVERHQLDRDRVSVSSEPESVGRTQTLERIDKRLIEVRATREDLLYQIATSTPGWPYAAFWAIESMGIDIKKCTIRYYKPRPGDWENRAKNDCYTFGDSRGVYKVFVNSKNCSEWGRHGGNFRNTFIEAGWSK